jgi:ankyrin repeat protein
VKIGDFGISKRIQHNLTALYTQVGTPAFLAPEVNGLIESEKSSGYTSAVDIWSLGCVIYQVLCQNVPFSDQNALLLFISAKVPFPARDLRSKSISPQGIGFLESLIVPDPSKRLSAVDALKSAWLRIENKPSDATNRQTLISSSLSQGPRSTSSQEESTNWNTWISVESSELETFPSTRLSDSVTSHRTPVKRKMIGSPSSRILDPEIGVSKSTSEQTSYRRENSSSSYPLPDQSEDISIEQSPTVKTDKALLTVPSRIYRKNDGVGDQKPAESVVVPPTEAHPAASKRNSIFGNFGNFKPSSTSRKENEASTKAAPVVPVKDVEPVSETAPVSHDVETPGQVGTSPKWTALHIAAQNGHESVLLSLLSYDSTDINARGGIYGSTPLYQAAMTGHDKAITILLDHGADPEKGNIQDRYTPLLIAAERGHKEAVEALLARGAGVNGKSHLGWTPLHVAAQNGHEAVVRTLLAKGASIHARTDTHGQTPLYQAALKGHDDIVTLLLESGADPNMANHTDKFTPLMIAAQHGHDGTVKILNSRAGQKSNPFSKLRLRLLKHAPGMASIRDEEDRKGGS